MKNLTFGGTKFFRRAPRGADSKFEKASYRMVVSAHTENLSIVAQLESVRKSGGLIRLLGMGEEGGLSPLRGSWGTISEIRRKKHTGR